MSLTKEQIKEKLIALGITAVLAGGIAAYLVVSQKPNINEFYGLFPVWNAKIQEIKQNCDTDVRCVAVGEEKRVNLGEIKDKKQVIEKLNTWVKEDNVKYQK